MKEKIISSANNSFLFISIFLVSVLYLGYHGYVSQMVIVQDAETFRTLAETIKNNGLIALVRQGTDREPFYPFVISLALRLSEILRVSFQDIQKFIQIGFLILAQGLLFIILRKLKIRPWIIAATILYFALSPAVLNSALSLWSEAVTYPFVLGIILLAPRIRQKLSTAFLLALCFIPLVFTKTVFEYIVWLFTAYLIVLIISQLKKHPAFSKKLLLALAVFLATYSLPVHFYKSANQKYHDTYAITSRGNLMLYGNAHFRTEPLTQERLFTLVQSIPGNPLSISAATDGAGYEEMNRLKEKGLTAPQVNREILKSSLREIFRNPFQYSLLTFMQSIHMFFWESTTIGFVVYPSWLEKIYNLAVIINPLRCVIAFLTLVALIFSLFSLWQKRKEIFNMQDEPTLLLFFTSIILVSYIGLHSVITVLTRYILPIVPLYLIILAYFFNEMMTTLMNRAGQKNKKIRTAA